jgi:peptidoglycan/xylan/chitin deacetylase (PgdA/CDA1 family)
MTRSAGLILLYHRLAEPDSDPQLLAVTPARFAEHLDVLRGYGCPMSVAQMMSALGDCRLPPRAIAVTFDDGYADSVEQGEPLLASYGVPATVFVATSYVGEEPEFWWDDLERLLLPPGEFPEWNVESPADPSPRHREYREWCRALRGVTREERRATLDELARTSGVSPAGRLTHRAVSRERLARACASGLIDVGAHTATHPSLSALSEAAQRREIEESQAAVREITGRDPVGFSYPFGGRTDYTRTTVRLVKDAGFGFACANIPGVVRPGSDPFQLPRMLVRNWDADTFAWRLREWLGD